MTGQTDMMARYGLWDLHKRTSGTSTSKDAPFGAYVAHIPGASHAVPLGARDHATLRGLLHGKWEARRVDVLPIDKTVLESSFSLEPGPAPDVMGPSSAALDMGLTFGSLSFLD